MAIAALPSPRAGFVSTRFVACDECVVEVMDAVLQQPLITMTVEPTVRPHAVPCKKRPLSWYKPPACPRNLGASQGTSGLDCPVNPGRDGSPINLTLSVSPVNQGPPLSLVNQDLPVSPINQSPPASPVDQGLPVSPVNQGPPVSHVNQVFPVSPTFLYHSVSPVSLGYPRCPTSPSHGLVHSPTRSPASPASSSSSHDESLQGRLEGRLQGPLPAAAQAPLLWPCRSNALGTPTPFASSLRPLGARKQSDFSIEHILRGAGTPRCPSPRSPAHQPDGHFEWLQCTRYRPPKLPRSRRRDGPAQRRLGRNPRIPFSPQQVAVLEARFFRSHYLSSADVAELSAQLELSETRVKIWFQNRRARERRDGDGRSTTSPSQNLTVTAKMPKLPTPSHLPRSTTSAFSIPKSQQIQNDVQSKMGSQTNLT
ncbi:Homeobox protein MSX-1 [Frankliniella fusca]|uniref:Homeobox protein MSX-1 n=1 Tax=Frankliniella fusca TaxID=407009 RepID=A0AAE1I1D2_9NEOP|nr:Homeobox protein MSX-1 [Frankliniella fusca]